MPRPIAALAVVAVLLLAGCAERNPAAPPAPAPSATSSATPSLPALNAPTPAPTLSSAPTSAAVSLIVHQGPPPAGVRRGPAWLVASAHPAAASVGIAWTDSVAPGCGAAKDVWLQETAVAVVIDLVHSVGRVGVVCPAVLVPRRATVPLAAPLGTRILEEHVSGPGSAGAACPSPGPIARSSQVVCPLTPKG
jgi:hypothetical protein